MAEEVRPEGCVEEARFLCDDHRMQHDITVRRMAFDFPEGLDPDFTPGRPERSYNLIGLSLLLPYLEPYLIRTMKEAKSRLTDPDLVVDLENFCAQEGQHYRQHIRFNRALRLSGYPDLEGLEEKLEADYLRFSRTRSLRFNLAYAEGFEALTTAFAVFVLENPDELADETPANELLKWHIVEELEHRTVAFDVYQNVCGSYFYRLAVGLFAQWHFLRFVGRVVRYMLQSSPETLEKYGGRDGLRKRRRADAASSLKLLPKVLRTYLPWYTPHDIAMTKQMHEAAVQQTERAITTSRFHPD